MSPIRQVTKLIDMSQRLEGLPRHTSMHAAGVVISQKSVDEYVPLSRGSDGSMTTQFTMTTLEELGLLKMDFLGLQDTDCNPGCRAKCGAYPPEKNWIWIRLTITIRMYWPQSVPVSTDGVFQLESAGMKNFMKELKPQSLEDIIAGISLYRPGPMDFIPSYIRGKNNPSSIVYDCPQLEPILSSDVRLYRLSGAGHADRAGSGRLYTGTK